MTPGLSRIAAEFLFPVTHVPRIEIRAVPSCVYRNARTSALLTRFQRQLEDEMKIHAAMTVAALALAPALAFAQSATVEGARSGAAAGAAVGGPVGGAVGGTVGAAVGTAVDIPAAVISAVTGLPGPSVVVRERVVVGEPLPGYVELRPVPSHTEYRYAVVNDQRVIVEPRTRRVIRIIE
jgi:hypothetical protein